MGDFDSFEILVLRWFSRHKIKNDTISMQKRIPLQYLKKSIFLRDKGPLVDQNGYLVLSQQAKDAVAEWKELSRRDTVHNFIWGVISGIAGTLLLEWITIKLFPQILQVLQSSL